MTKIKCEMGFFLLKGERLIYRQAAEVGYRSKGGAKVKVFDALEWLAAMCSHVPNKGRQMVRYYGFYSNVFSGEAQESRRG